VGRLTTHVLDLLRGAPAAGMTLELVALDGVARRVAVRVTTNRDGRLDAPLLEGAAMVAGTWQLEFHVAAYYASQQVALAKPPFLDVVVLRFGIANPAEHYHVPLLVTPWSYSTYRGS